MRTDFISWAYSTDTVLSYTVLFLGMITPTDSQLMQDYFSPTTCTGLTMIWSGLYTARFVHSLPGL